MLKARKSVNKCEICWQKFKDNDDRPRIIYQNKKYHQVCFDKKFKAEKKAEHKIGRGKKSL